MSELDGSRVRTAGEQASAISRLLVQTVSEYTGRGPTRARSAISDHVITVILDDSLTKAELSLDDGPPLPNPYTLNVVPDSRPHRLRVRLAGFEDREQDITFDRGRDVVVVLRASAAGNRKPGPRVATPQQPHVGEQPAKPQQPKMGELPPVGKRVPRTLDNDNPFAQKP